MADPNKLAQLNSATTSKQNSLGVIKRGKQGSISRVSPSAPSAPSNPGIDPNNFKTIGEYEAAIGGFATTDVSTFFMERTLRESQRNHEIATVAHAKRNERAWATDGEKYSIGGQLKNMAAGIASTTARMGGYVVAGPSNIKSFVMDQMLGDEVLDIAARERSDNKKQKGFEEELNKLNPLVANGTLTEAEAFLKADQIKAQRAESAASVTAEERALLDGPYKNGESNMHSEGYVSKTLREAAEESYEAQEYTNKVRADAEASIAGLTNETYGAQLDKSLGETWQENSHYLSDAKAAYEVGDYDTMVGQTALGVANLVADGTKDLISNPAATLNVVAENLPYLALGAFSAKAMAVTNIAYSTDIYSQAIEEYKLEHDGQVPSNSEARYMLGVSLTAGVAESLGNMKILSSIRKIPGLDKVVDGPAGKAVTNAVDKAASSKLLDNGIVRVANAGVSSGATEAVTEMYQTAVEESFSRLNTDFNGEHLFKAGILGGASGGIMAGTGRSINEAGTGVLKAVSGAPTLTRQDKHIKDEKTKARESGDVTNLLDPEHKAYSPSGAVASLAFRVLRSDLSDEDKATSTAKIDELIAIQTAKTELAEDEFIKESETRSPKDKLVGKLHKEVKAQTQALKEMIQAQEMVAVGELDKTKLSKMFADLDNVEDLPARDLAARKVIGLAIRHPELMTSYMGADQDEVAAQIAEFAENPAFTPEERTYLQNFSASHAAANAVMNTEGVTENVIEGAPGFTGINMYRAAVANAIRLGSKASALKQTAKLKFFSEDHTKKEAAHRELLSQVEAEMLKPKAERKKMLIAIKPTNPDGEWEITSEIPAKWNRATNGGWETNTDESQIGALTAKINGMALENEMLSTASTELDSAIEVGFAGAVPDIKTDAPVSADAAPVAPVESDGASIDADLAAEENTADSAPELNASQNKRLENRKDNLTEASNTKDPLKIANALAKLKHTVDSGGGTEADTALIEATEKQLKDDGYEVVELKGTKWSEGQILQVKTFTQDDTLAEGTDVITRVIEPQVNDSNGKMIQSAKVVVALGTKPLTTQETTGKENTAAPLPDLIAALDSAQDVGAKYDMWNSDATDPKVKADLEAETAAYKALETGVARVIERIQSFGTESAKKLKAKEKEVRGQSEKDNQDLVALANAALKYEKEYNAAQSQLDFSNENQGDNNADLQQAEETKSQAPEEIANTGTPISESADVGAIKQILRDNNWVNEDGTLKPSNSRNMPEVIEGVFIDSPSKLLAEAKNQLINEASNETESKTAEEAQEVPDLTQESANPYSVESIKATYKKEGIVNADGTLRKLGVQEMSKELEDIRMEAPLETLEQVKAELLAEAAEEATAGPQAEAVDSVDETKTNQPITQENNEQAAPQPSNETEKGTQEGDATQEPVADEQSEATEATDPEQISEEEANPDLLENVFTALDKLVEIQMARLFNIDNQAEKVEGNLDRDGQIDRNSVWSYFEQSGGDSKSKTKNPLTHVKDFMSQLVKGKVINVALLKRFLEGDLDAKQQYLIRLASAFRDLLEPHINKNAFALTSAGKETNPAYRHRNFIKFLIDPKTNKLPENIVTAVSMAGFTWLSENGDKLYNNASDIRSILGLSDDAYLSAEDFAYFKYKGTRLGNVVREMGKKAAQAAGLRARKDAPANVQAQLEMALGAQALVAMIQSGFLKSTVLQSPSLARPGMDQKINTVTNPDGTTVTYLTDLKGKPIEADENGDPVPWDRQNQAHPFITVSQSSDGVATEEAGSIVNAAKKSKGIINRLFSIERKQVAPADKSGSYKQSQVKKTLQQVPAVLRKILELVSTRPHSFSKSVQDKRVGFSRDNTEIMAGREDKEFTHSENAVKDQSKREDIGRSIDNLDQYESEGEKGKSFFFTPVMWVQQRVGLLQNLINPQQNKFHRANVIMDAWLTEIFPKAKSSANAVRMYKLAMAQKMGIKIENQSHERSIEQLEELMRTPLIKKGLAALSLVNGKELPATLQKDVVDAVAGRDDFMSFKAMVSWIEFLAAEKAGGSFTTDMTFEVDGTSNGPALAHVLLGVIGEQTGEMFGFFSAETPFSSYEEAKENQLSDIYEAVAGLINQRFARDKDQDHITAILHFAGPLTEQGEVTPGGRKFSKGFLPALVFGAGVPSMLADMGDNFVELFYSQLEKDLSAGGIEAATYTVSQMNVLLGKRNHFKMPVEPTADWFMNLKLSLFQKTLVRESFENGAGRHIEAVIDAHFSKFIETRGALNEGAQAIHEVYEAAYDTLYRKIMNKKMDNGEISYTTSAEGIKRPHQDLSSADIAAIELELEPIRPLIHTAMSKMTGEITEGIDVSSVDERAVGRGNDMFGESYSQDVDLGDSFRQLEDPSNNQDPNEPGSVREERLKSSRIGAVNRVPVSGQRAIRSAPGVRAVIMLVHALDSAIASNMYGVYSALNNHDGFELGARQLLAGAPQLLNESTMDLLIDYSLPLEMHAALERALDAQEAMILKNPELKEVFEAATIGKGQSKKRVDRDLLATLYETAVEAEVKKLNFLASVEFVHQYAFEGQGHTVTAEQKARIEAKLLELAATPQQANPAPKAKTRTKSEEKPEPNLAARSLPEDTPWGVAGMVKPGTVQAILSMLKTKGLTAKELIPLLAEHVQKTNKGGRLSKFRFMLLRGLNKTAISDTPIIMITPQTPIDQYPGLMESGVLDHAAAAYFDNREGVRGIFVRSPEFHDSKIEVETLLHELTHAATAYAITRYEYMNPSEVPIGEKGAYEAYQELSELYSAVQEFTDNPENASLKEKFEPALESIDEMVAWGMTNVEFQTEVLSKVQMNVSKRSIKSGQESGLRKFIKALSKLFFERNPSEFQTNGMASLIVNTALIMELNREAFKVQSMDVIANAMKTPDPRTFTTKETFESLVGDKYQVTDPDYLNHLIGVLTRITEKVYAGGVLKAAAERLAVVTAEDVYLKALHTGNAPFASLLKYRLEMSDQEGFVAESVEVALSGILPNYVEGRTELQRIFEQAKKAIKPEDLPAGAWEMIFSPLGRPDNNSDSRSDYLAQFAAASLAYKPLHEKMSNIRLEGDGIKFEGFNPAQLLIQLVSKILNRLSMWRAGTNKNQSLMEAAASVAENMATVEAAKKADLLARKAKPETWLNTAPKAAKDALREGVKKATSSKLLAGSSSQLVRVGRQLVEMVSEDRISDYADFFEKIYNSASKGRLGLPGEIINEIRNGRDGLRAANWLLDKMGLHETTRKHGIDETSRDVIDSFGRKLTRAESEALTTIIMRAELSSLKGYSMSQIDSLLSDRAFLEKAIKEMEDQITGKHRKYYLAQAKALGQNLMTGRNESEHLMLNAYAIAHRTGTKRKAVSPSEIAAANEAITTLDPLITLYALRDSDKNHRKLAIEVLREESNRVDDKGNKNPANGFSRMIQMHSFLQEQAKKTLFAGAEIQMRKGYTNETFNPHIQITAATAEVGAQLLKSGYKELYPGERALPKDSEDISDGERRLYVVTGQGLGRHVTGIMSNSSMAHQGTTIDGDLTIATTGELSRKNTATNKAAIARRAKRIEALFDRDENWRPGKGGDTFMAPILNPKGEVVNYRYLMLEKTKIETLERIDNIDKVMGNIAGSIIDKAATPELNEQAVDAFKAEFDANHLKDQNAYMMVSASSEDPVVAERYRLLPKDTQAYIRKVWGRNGMVVRRDVYQIAFGYRKFSLGDAFEKDKNQGSHLRKLLISILGQVEIVTGEGSNQKITYMPSSKARWLVRGENAWQEIVKVVKDIVVIKNIVTLLGNQTSNMSILALSGVPLGTIVKHTFTGIMGAHNYRKNSIERNRLERAISVDHLVGKELQESKDRIVELDEAMEANPVKDLVDAGMYQTLVEDLSQESDPYSYQSKLSASAEKVLNIATTPLQVIPGSSAAGKAIKVIGSNLFLTHDTQAYKFLNRATVMSDFSSRYVLYKHLTERRVDPLSKEDSLHRARQAFVNYDVPTHKALQYLNDAGFIWFTKYYLRIQAVIAQIVRDNPVRALVLIGANNLLFPIADILDSSALTKWPVNFGWGAGEIINAWDEIAPANAALSLID